MICETCGSPLRKYSVPLSLGIVQALIKFHKAVVRANLNKIHLQHDINLTKNEYNNFQKLRYHGLVVKYKEDGEHLAGYWLLTRRGADFLRGDIMLPKSVQVFNNKLVGKSAEVVSIKDVIKGGYFFEHQEDIKYEEATVEDVEVALISKKKRRKNPCPKCEGELRIWIKSKEIKPDVFKVEKYNFCESCKYEIKIGVDNV